MEILSGAHLFKCRKDSPLDFGLFEDFYRSPIPPIYKIFVTNFIIKRGAREKIEVFIDQDNRCFNIVELNYKGDYSDYIGLYDLYSIEESIASMQNSYSSDDEIHDMEYAIIGECADNNSILLGLGEKNRDQIFLECTSIFPSGERIVKISDNIFSFINGLSLCEKAKVGYGIESYSELYKNWNEPFWRVGEKR